MRLTVQTDRRGNQGFILVTSLVFLVVLTLLAVSAINSSTLQERMASNLREKNRALQAANAGLSEAERLLGQPAFLTCFSLLHPQPAPDAQCSSPAGVLATSHINIAPATPADNKGNASTPDFTDDSAWTHSHVMHYQLSNPSDNPALAIDYQVDYLSDLSRPPAQLLFRITARAQGASSTGRAVAQSVYEIQM